MLENIKAMMEEKLNKVVINGELVAELNDDDCLKLIDVIKNIHFTEEPKKLVAKLPEVKEEVKEEPKVETKEDPKEEEEEKYPSIEPNVPDEKKFLATDLVSIYLEGRKYKAFFNYKLIGKFAWDKNKKKIDKDKYKYMKGIFRDEIKSFGAVWVEYNPEDKDDPRGCYIFPKKQNAEEYKALRLQKDKEYKEKRGV